MASQTGPRSTVGKLISSRNALKQGIYSNALLPNEDLQALETLAEDLANRFGVEDAAGEILVRQMLQTVLQSNRLQKAQTDMIQAKMHTMEYKYKFCKRVGIHIQEAAVLPEWYFEENSERKNTAIFITTVWAEARLLKNEYSVELMQRAKVEFPNLWKYVMGKEGSATQKVYATLGERIGSMYKQPKPETNLQELIRQIENDHHYELLYVKHIDRFESVIQGLRGQATMDIYSNPNFCKAAAITHKRFNDQIATAIGLQRDKSKNTVITCDPPEVVTHVQETKKSE